MKWLSFFLVASAVLAQNNEIVLQGGTAFQSGDQYRIAGTNFSYRIDQSNQVAAGFSYGRSLWTGDAAGVWLQIPVFAVAEETAIQTVLSQTTGVSAFVTPSVMLKLAPHARLTPFVFGGFGYARLVALELTDFQPVRGSLGDQGTWAATYGGGLDLRLFRWLALRGEIRGFTVGTSASTGVFAIERNRNTLLGTGGIGFRF